MCAELEEAAGPGSGPTPSHTPRAGMPGPGRGAELLKQQDSGQVAKPPRQPASSGGMSSQMKGLSLGGGPPTTSSAQEMAAKKGTAGQK